MSDNKVFTGMVKIDAIDALVAAKQCICYIEHKRTQMFQEEVNETLNDPPVMKWWFDDYKFDWKHLSKWFRSYIIVNNREEAISYTLKYSSSWWYPKWETFMNSEYVSCINIMNLQHNDNIYITPKHGMIINRYQDGEYDINTAEDNQNE